MTTVAVKDICGLGPVPADRTAASTWLRRLGVDIHRAAGNGGEHERVNLRDLPATVRRAYELRQAKAEGLEPGDYDDEAHGRLLSATPAMLDAAHRKAEIARFLRRGGATAERGLTADLISAAREKFGGKGTDKMTLRRILKEVEGVAPINFAPALLPDYVRDASPRAAMSPEAWSFFLTLIKKAFKDWPLSTAYDRVLEDAPKNGWDWPSYTTVYRRWMATTPAQRRHARLGTEAAAESLAMPAMRDKTTLRPLDMVSLDGRTLDFWVDFGDGKAVRPTMIALVDVRSGYILSYEITRSENAPATGRVVRAACQRFGVPDKLQTDNSKAFSGHLIAGGIGHRWRNRSTSGSGPIGICGILGIEITHSIPKRPRGKFVERVFATLSRTIDDAPEFDGAHAGHAPGAAPDAKTVPVPIATALAVIAREIERHNRKTGRRGQGAHGRSYEQIFNDGLKERIIRRPTEDQLYHASLFPAVVAVDRYGRVRVDNWSYGGPDTQAELLDWHKKGKITLYRDPLDFEAPAVAYAPDGRFICEGIQPVKAGAYDSVDGTREAARNRKAARDAVAAGEAASNYLSDEKMKAALAAPNAPDAPPAPEERTVVGGVFTSPLRPKRAATEPATGEVITPEMLANFDRGVGYNAKKFGG